jgi:hypothetical protein
MQALPLTCLASAVQSYSRPCRTRSRATLFALHRKPRSCSVAVLAAGDVAGAGVARPPRPAAAPVCGVPRDVRSAAAPRPGAVQRVGAGRAAAPGLQLAVSLGFSVLYPSALHPDQELFNVWQPDVRPAPGLQLAVCNFLARHPAVPPVSTQGDTSWCTCTVA